MFTPQASIVFVLALFISAAQCLHLPLVGTPRTVLSGHELARREFADRTPSRLFARATADLKGSATLSDLNNLRYNTEIKLGNSFYTVEIDTGSSDLFVASAPNPSFVNSGVEVAADFIGNGVKGSVATANLEFGGATVENQAFISIAPTAQHPAGQGLVGLGPSTGSNVLLAMKSAASSVPPLDRVFRGEASADTFITVALGRTSDPETPASGSLTIGEVLPQYSGITSTPKLPVSVLPKGEAGIQHWQTLTDANGVSVNGKPVTTPANASRNIDPKAKNSLSFIFDTGFTLPQVPSYLADAFYKDIPGARKENVAAASGEVYVIPCTAELDIAFSFGGQRIPIHPLDANLSGWKDDNGNDICIGAFQPALPGVQSKFEDGNLGMAFLRNVYMLINYGSLLADAPAGTATPYMQLLSLTDSVKAHQDFVSVRGKNSFVVTGPSNIGAASVQKSGASGASSLFRERAAVVSGILGLAVLLWV